MAGLLSFANLIMQIEMFPLKTTNHINGLFRSAAHPEEKD